VLELRNSLLEEALLLALLARLVGKGRDEQKKRLGPFVSPGASEHPVVDGMDAGAVLRTRGEPGVGVEDHTAFIKWLLRFHPTEVTQECRDAYWKLFTVSGDGSTVVAPDGTADVPGLVVVPGNPVLRVTPSDDPAVAAALWAKYRPILNQLLPGGTE
jgi:hypothetical protein